MNKSIAILNPQGSSLLKCRARRPLALPGRACFGLVLAGALALAGNSHAQLSATLTDIGPTAPTSGPDDIAQTVTGSGKPDELNYYFDNGTPPGQIFTTGTNPNGYVLNSLAIATAGDSGGIPAAGQTYELRIYTVAGGNASLMASYTSQPGFLFFDFDWLQWTDLSLGLQPGAQYAYSFARTSNGWENMANTGGNVYTGGEVALIPKGGGAITLGASHSFDAAFHVGLTPATSILANPPSISQSPVLPGTSVTISVAPAVGPGPLSYQWQTDGGSGGALTNIPSATGLSLGVSTTGLPPGSYRYGVLVSSGANSITGAPAVLVVYQAAGATLTDVGTSILPGQYDLSQLTGGGDGDGLNYYDDNGVPPGQTFTTGTNPQGYYLNSVTLGTGGGTSGHTDEPRAYSLWIYSVTGSNATLVAHYTDESFSFTYGDWVTWSGFPPLILKPNSTYAYAFRMTSGNGWAGMTTTPATTDLYSGGQICLIPQEGGAMLFGNSGVSDAAFNLGMLPIGVAFTAPTASSIVISPSLVVATGTQVTLTESATGAAPLYYQWQTDGASGGTLTNIPSSDATNLVLNTAGWNAGVYRFAVIVTNSYGASTSAVASLTVAYPSTPATLTDIGPVGPIPRPEDASQTLPATFANKPDDLNYYFNNSAPPGQTFTTGSNPGGYTLNTLAIQMAGDSGGLPAEGQNYQLRIYSVSGGTAALHATYVSEGNFVILADTDWLRWSELALPLAPNTTYAYTLYAAGGWDNLGNVSGNPYPGGEVCLIPPSGGAIQFGASHDYDGVFIVGLVPAGYPIVTPAAFSPANQVYAGSPVTVSASATGTGPFTYRWQTDGGTGVYSDIPGADAASLSVDTAPLAGLNVGFALVAANGSGTTTGQVSHLTVLSASPPLIVSPYTLPEANVALAGSSVRLFVNETGTLPLTNHWSLNGVSLQDDGRVSGSRSNVLIIPNVMMSDAGHYQLSITNSQGYLTGPGLGADQTLLVVTAPSFFTNGIGWVGNNGPTILDNTLTLIDAGGQARSFFFNSPIHIGAFKASFIYQDVGGGGADGFTFCLQNDPRGAAAVGGGGAGLGVSGISPSAAVTFNIYGNPGISFTTNGANFGPYAPTGPVNIAGGNPIAIDLVYANGNLQVSLTDTTANVSFTTNMAVGNLPALAGGQTAYVGFTGASGGVSSTQTLSAFSYMPLTSLSARIAGADLVLNWPTLPGGYELQSRSSLTSGNWQSVAATAIQVAGQNQVSIPLGTAAPFYRLVLEVPAQ